MPNQWYSMELHWKKDSMNGIGGLWVDGTLVCSISNKNTDYFGDVDRACFGLTEIYNCGATSLYCDDCVISESKIGE